MRLILVGVLVAVVGCGSGAEPGDYVGTGGADAGAAGGAGGQAIGGAPGTGGAAAGSNGSAGAPGCYVPLSMISGKVTSASSSGDLSGINQQQSDQQNCRAVGTSLAQGVTEIIDGQPTGAAGWTETFFSIVPSGSACAVMINYTQAIAVRNDTCTYSLSVTLTVPPQ